MFQSLTQIIFTYINLIKNLHYKYMVIITVQYCNNALVTHFRQVLPQPFLNYFGRLRLAEVIASASTQR